MTNSVPQSEQNQGAASLTGTNSINNHSTRQELIEAAQNYTALKLLVQPLTVETTTPSGVTIFPQPLPGFDPVACKQQQDKGTFQLPAAAGSIGIVVPPGHIAIEHACAHPKMRQKELPPTWLYVDAGNEIVTRLYRLESPTARKGHTAVTRDGVTLIAPWGYIPAPRREFWITNEPTPAPAPVWLADLAAHWLRPAAWGNLPCLPPCLLAPPKPGGETSLAAAAVAYAEAGFRPWPLRPGGKIPLIAGYNNPDIETSPESIRKAWEQRPDMNIALVVTDGLAVLDLDVRPGERSIYEIWEHLEQVIGGQVPETLMSQSGRGVGCHLWFSTPKGMNLRNDTNVLPQVDSRTSWKGYVAAPPSIHPDTGQPGRWLNQLAPAPMPAKLEHLLRPKPAPIRRVTRLRPGNVTRRMQGLARTVAEKKEGERNSMLHYAACRVYEDMGGDQAALDAIRDAAAATGLPPREIEATIRSARNTINTGAVA